MKELPTKKLKTRNITFDDRLQQIRIIHKNKKGQPKEIEFHNYPTPKGKYYIKKYLRPQKK